MADGYVNPSALSRGLSSESWQDVVDFNDEPNDTFFPGDAGLFKDSAKGYKGIPSIYQVPESGGLVRPCGFLAPDSYPDGLDYTGSAPPSVEGASSSLPRPQSWLSTLSSSTTNITSPVLVGRHQPPYDDSFNNCEEFGSSFGPNFESPVLEPLIEPVPNSFGSSNNSFHTAFPLVFNPFLANSPHAFNGPDVSASQAFANVGDWADQPQIIEPAQEPAPAGAIPIPIPQAATQNFTNTFGPYPWSQPIQQQDENRTKAITIPQPNRRLENRNPNITVAPSSEGARNITPALSISPEARRRPRSMTMSRSNSKTEPRRNNRNNHLASPSPTSNTTFSWFNYQSNAQTNKLVLLGTDGSRGKRNRGRTKALTAEQRRNAAIMRVVKVCSNCKRRKERCDVSIPCKSCLDHYKGDLINHPCRGRRLTDLSKHFFSDRLGWHPTNRRLETFFAPPHAFHILTPTTYTIPLSFGFGPALHAPVHAVNVTDTRALYHKHMIYPWPPSSRPSEPHTHAVLPAVLTQPALHILADTLDNHLSLLVTHHFHSFPLFCSPLRILRDIYVLSRSLALHNTAHANVLHQALKLLVLVHVGGDITISSPSSSLPEALTPFPACSTITPSPAPTPCLIRAQFGATMPHVAQRLMHEVLASLEQILLQHEAEDWGLGLAVLLTVLMTVESVQYHAAKIPYHDAFDESGVDGGDARNEEVGGAGAEDVEVIDDEEGVRMLVRWWEACFGGIQGKMLQDNKNNKGDGGKAGSEEHWEDEGFELGEMIWESEITFRKAMEEPLPQRPEEKFVESVREVVSNTESLEYLGRKARGEKKGKGDMEFYFDRLVARVLTMRSTAVSC